MEESQIASAEVPASRIPVIGVYVPTRGRHHLAVSTLNMWQHLAADAGNIRFLMGVDHDDEDAKKFIPGDSLKIHTFDESVVTCGGRVKAMADMLDVDIYLAIVDYYTPLTQYWDNTLRQLMAAGGNEIVNLTYAPAPTAFHITACSKRWMALANRFEPEIFPFWFSDQWRVEMHSYVFNKPPMTYSDVVIGGAHSQRTHNMHDVDFWWGLFHALRPRRLREAYEVYKGYGMTAPTFEKFVDSRRDHIDLFVRVDEGKRRQLASYQQNFGQLGTPVEKYKRAKADAEALIEREGLELWKMQLEAPAFDSNEHNKPFKIIEAA